MSGTVAASEVRRILAMPQLRGIRIDSVGKRKPIHSPAEPARLRWFAVRALFAIQVEGETTGMQDYDDRIVLVQAFDFDDAVNRLRPSFKEYGEPSLHPNGYLVRWQFEKVVDVYDTCDEELDPKGTEVYSTLKRRRMRPEYEWHPQRAKAARPTSR